MYRIAIIIPDKGMAPLVESVIRQDGSITRNIQNAPRYSYSVHVAQEVRDLGKDVIDADTVIARGHIFAELRKVYPNLSLVELPIGSEMTATIVSAINARGQIPVAVIGSFNMCYAAQAVKDLFDVDVKAYLLETRDKVEISNYVRQAVEEGRRIIICGSATEEYVDGKKYPDVYTYMMGLSRESVLEAITRAKGEMVTRKREKERAAQFQMLINIAHEGIIACEADGQINAINRVATEMLGVLAAKAMGASLWSVLPADLLPESFKTALSSQAVIAYRGRKLSVRLGRMKMAGETAGIIVTLHNLHE